ncbi:MAG: hypothetical protein ABI690_24430 [Chloroflexota bacterium]
MLRQVGKLLTLLIVALVSGSIAAQDSGLSAENAAKLVPIAVYSAPIQAISPDGQYLVIGEKLPGQGYNGKLVTREGETLLDLGSTASATFVQGDQLLHVSLINSQSARVYQLPGLEEVGRFPLGVQPVARRYGTGYFYILKEKQAFYQPADLTLDPVFLAKDLHFPYANMVIAESPDGHTAAVANVLGIWLYDLDKGEKSGQIDYPVAAYPEFSADGKRLSAITNEFKNWLAYDLDSGKSITELYSARMAAGTISASGKYGAVTRQLTDSGIGELTVFNLDSGEQIFQTKTAQFGYNPQYGGAFGFAGDLLVYHADFNGKTGKVAVFNPASGESKSSDVDTDTFIFMNGLVLLYNFDTQQTSIFDPASASVTVSFSGYPVVSDAGIGVQGVLFGLPDDAHPALTTVTGTTKSANINVRSYPSKNGTRVTGASGAITALARTPDNAWVYLSSHSGWVSTTLITLDGDIDSLMVVAP